MELLITYDVETVTPEGQRRLRTVARICEGHGHRVQKSVFEVTCTPAQRLILEAALRGAIDPDNDSVRIYQLTAGTFTAAGHLGSAAHIPHSGPFIL